MYPRKKPQRGFTLLVAVIIASVSLAVALTLLDIAYKQITLAITAKQSQYAFARADSALECALYWDQVQDAFRFEDPFASGIHCSTGAVLNYDPVDNTSDDEHTITFDVPCSGGGIAASVTVYKRDDAETFIYANGYNTCSVNDTRRVERGLRVHY